MSFLLPLLQLSYMRGTNQSYSGAVASLINTWQIVKWKITDFIFIDLLYGTVLFKLQYMHLFLERKSSVVSYLTPPHYGRRCNGLSGIAVLMYSDLNWGGNNRCLVRLKNCIYHLPVFFLQNSNLHHSQSLFGGDMNIFVSTLSLDFEFE